MANYSFTLTAGEDIFIGYADGSAAASGLDFGSIDAEPITGEVLAAVFSEFVIGFHGNVL
jgi:hypothetical protein